MTRRTAVLATCLFALLVIPTVATAGGGCHGGVTDGTGDTVELVDACFTPTTLRIEPGQQVTFVNRDPMIHNVTANLWGHFDDLDQGDAFTATFEQEGVYPYACTYHPGMTGAIVVGDGDGPGSGQAVPVGAFEEPPAPSPRIEVRTITRPEDPGASSPLVWLTAAIGLVVGLGLGSLVRRGRAGTAS
jgi:plastocyanin